ncbi:SPFH domain-containing protein [Shewanella sp. MEBiC00475]|uniref:SPFH domain-containing protein n=1 Tax=Shewanella sp. MEBiC00475 TaxID=2575361 RepID=UPI0010BFBA99|nr:SPFH domain-containing protein [Shewanella sp. MEBiC00475]
MFGLKYIKADPSTHLMLFKKGNVIQEGVGVSFFYYAPSSSLVAIPSNSKELPFVFRLQTADFQELSLQGQITYRIEKPREAAKMLNFTIEPTGQYVSDDPKKLDERVQRAVQVLLRNHIESMTLKNALTCARQLTLDLKQGLGSIDAITSLGVGITDVSLTAIKPTPETGKALEAEIRESLLKEADSAIYARRLASIEQEKSVKESELETEKAIQKKQQDLETSKLEAARLRKQQQFKINQETIQAQIEDEKQLEQLVTINAANERARGDVQAYKIQVQMQAYQNIDIEKLKVMSMSGMKPEQLIAQAIENLTQGDNKVGNLNLSPDLLLALTNRQDGSRG